MLQKQQRGMPPKIFETDFTITWKHLPFCVNCQNEFTMKYVSSAERNQSGSYGKQSRRPLLFECGHNICEHCALGGKRRPSIQCGACKKVYPRISPLRQNIEHNYHLLGQVTYRDISLDYDLDLVPTVPKPNAENLYECCECNRKCTKMFCVQCSVPYCQPCFDLVHKLGKALKKHCLSMMQKEKKLDIIRDSTCIRHHRVRDIYCTLCKESLCAFCISAGHEGHTVITILAENKKYTSKIQSLIEMVDSATQMNQSALKNTRLMEKRYTDYGSQAVQKVSDYFLELHQFLQLLERNTVMCIKDRIVIPLSKLQSVQRSFNESLKTLEHLTSSLGYLSTSPPANQMLSEVVERTNSILETLPLYAEFENSTENPISFNIVADDLKVQIESAFEIAFHSEDIKMNIRTYFGDISRSFDDNDPTPPGSATSASISDPLLFKHRKRTLVEPDDHFSMDFSSNFNIEKPTLLKRSSKFINLQKVYVTHIDSPEQFYVHKEDFHKDFDKLKNTWAMAAEKAIAPEQITLGGIYLVKSSADRLWYRAQVTAMVSSDTYKAFIMDFGSTLTVSIQRFRQIPEVLRNQPPGAHKCKIYGIKPKMGKWTAEINIIMSDIIENEIVNAIYMSEDDIHTIELITTHRKHPVSIRDALLFMGLADQKTDHKIAKETLQVLENVKIKLLPKIKDKIYKTVYKPGGAFRVEVIHVVHPQEFYAIREADIGKSLQITRDLMHYYQNNPSVETIYCPQVHMPCGVFIKGSVSRAVIESILDDGKVKVFCVDSGQTEAVTYKDIRALPETFLTPNQLVLECCLADIETKQENNYTWTTNAIKDFKQILQNPNIQCDIRESKKFRYKVYLLLVKKTMDVNVNALLVHYNHAISTATDTLTVKVPKHRDMELTDDSVCQPVLKDNSKPSSIANTSVHQTKPELSRTPIQIIHMESPGEFYIHLKSHVAGVDRLVRNIQSAQAKKQERDESESLIMSWKVGESCLILTNLKGAETGSWYRGRIQDINDDLYTVFLIDHGRKIRNVTIFQLDAIPIEYIRIADSAIRCHMACVEPTGGIDDWSQTSIEQFQSILDKYSSFSASIQGKKIQRSIPVVVWSLFTQCTDPLEPNICKWININLLLANSGFAHVIEKFDLVAQVDGQIEQELKDGQQTINQWLKEIDEIKMIKSDDGSFIEDIVLPDLVAEYMKPIPIGKSIFTGYPTYVDHDGYIYLHDAEKHQLLENMRNKINKQYRESLPNSLEVTWYTGQPCLARFHIDNNFYRAIVIKQNPDKIVKVRYVDYGNIEDCSISDLRNITAFPRIPEQANVFKLFGIQPKAGETKFSLDALDTMHLKLVSKLCSIKLVEGEELKVIPQCVIHFENQDIAEYLISSELVGFDETVPAFRRYLNRDFYKRTKYGLDRYSHDNNPLLDDDMQCLLETLPEKPHTAVKAEVLKEMFENIELETLYNGNPAFCQLPKGNSDEEDIIELECTFNSEYWQKQLEDPIADIDDSLVSFTPKDTSSIKSRHSFTDQFKSLIIPQNVTSFYCEVNAIRSPTVLYVSPFIPDHENRLYDMTKRIQQIARSSPPLQSFKTKTPCLALYQTDNKWYRAIIRSYSVKRNEVDIVYVDYLNGEKVSVDMVRKCPSSLFDIPLKNMQVSLYGLRPNTRMRNSDIQRKLSDLVANKKIFARIVPSDDKIPRVQLYESQSEQKITIYDSLIAGRYYTIDNE